LKPLFSSGTVLVLVFVACAFAVPPSAQREKTYVAIDDIGSNVVVVGRLGVPLRKMTYFKARWIPSPDRSKPESIPLRLKIIEIDEVAVEHDVLFLPADVYFVDAKGQELAERDVNREIKLHGYEDWVTYGPPQEFDQAIGKPPVSPPPRGCSQIRAIVLSR
jgi:hypothetical protein